MEDGGSNPFVGATLEKNMQYMCQDWTGKFYIFIPTKDFITKEEMILLIESPSPEGYFTIAAKDFYGKITVDDETIDRFTVISPESSCNEGCSDECDCRKT